MNKWQIAERIIAEVKYGEKDFLAMVREECLKAMEHVANDVLEWEVEKYVGAGYHERCPDRRFDRRNGHHKRELLMLGGIIQLWVPRGRKGGFRSRFLEAYARREPAFDHAVIALYTGGLSVRETSAVMHESLDSSVGRSTVARIVQCVDADRETFQNRPLSDDYRYFIFDGMRVHCMIAPPPKVVGAKDGESVEEVTVLLVRGVKTDGTCEIIDFRVAPGESEEAWTAFLVGLFNRGLESEAAELIVHDGSDGLQNAIATVYGTQIATQRCVCHKLGNVEDAVENKQVKCKVREDASAIYQARDPGEARERLAAFCDKWSKDEPGAVKTMQTDFEDTLRFFEVPLEHRRWILTTNLLERAIREIRRRTRSMNTFMGLEHLQRAIYIAIRKTSNERRDAIPFALWAKRPPRRRSQRKRIHPPADIDARRKEFIDQLADQLRVAL